MLAKAAFQKLYVQNPAIDPQDITIIGDTPHDIICANAIGARSLIVLAGSGNSEAELKKHNPWKIIPQLPNDSEAFFNYLAE